MKTVMFFYLSSFTLLFLTNCTTAMNLATLVASDPLIRHEIPELNLSLLSPYGKLDDGVVMLSERHNEIATHAMRANGADYYSSRLLFESRGASVEKRLIAGIKILRYSKENWGRFLQGELDADEHGGESDSNARRLTKELKTIRVEGHLPYTFGKTIYRKDYTASDGGVIVALGYYVDNNRPPDKAKEDIEKLKKIISSIRETRARANQ